MSEEAILTSQLKNSSEQTKKAKDKNDEIALKLHESKELKEIKEQVSLMLKGKGSKSGPSNKGKRKWNDSEQPWNWNQQSDTKWNQPDNRGKGWNDWSEWKQPTQQDNWMQSTHHDKGKGRGKSSSKGKNLDPKLHWCDIHQKFGHSTDYCFENPNRTGGKPLAEMWCDVCYKSGHTTNWCFNNPKGLNKGKARPDEQAKGEKGKSNKGNRNWKSQNFPADYKAEQATPVLHDEAPSTVKMAVAWWDTKD